MKMSSGVRRLISIRHRNKDKINNALAMKTMTTLRSKKGFYNLRLRGKCSSSSTTSNSSNTLSNKSHDFEVDSSSSSSSSSNTQLIKSIDFAKKVCAPFRAGDGLENILLNPNDDDTFTHVEVNREDVRLEFRNPWDPTYQYFASLFVARGNREEYEKVWKSSPENVRALAPAIKDVRNSISNGAGATVYVSP